MSQLRVNEFVNSDDTGAPSFPNSATTIQPTESDQFATKLYVDQNSAIVTPITNNISPTEPSNPSVGDFWTDISDLTLITLSVWNGSEWITVKATQDNPTTEAPGPVAGSIISPPSILDDNSGYIPAMLTAVSANVSDATLASSKWYKDDVEIPGATGLQFYATEIGTYKYEEVWEDTFGNQLFPSLAAVIDARAGVILSQPTVSSSNGDYIPTVLTVTPGVVADAEFAGSKWYKDGVEIPGETGTTLSVSDIGIYMYRESWTDFFTTELLPVIAVTIDARTGIIATQPTITSSNGDYIPTVLTATRADVDHATFVGSKWYKDDVEIPGETGTTLSVSDIGVYKYEEVWTDYFSTEFLPALSATIDARRGIIATQPTITSSNGNYSPATLVATRAHVDNATFVESKWYKDGVEIPGETGLSITISATESGTYTYQEVWTDYFSTEFLPALGASLQVFGEIATPSVLSPADDTGVPDFDYAALSSAITNVGTVEVLGDDAFDIKTYTGNSSSQKLTTGLDMSGSGGLFWLKQRNGDGNHWLYDSERGPDSHLRIGAYEASNHGDSYDVNFENDGVTLGSNGSINYSGNTYVGWSFLEEPGFFDVVKWTGNGNSGRQIPHSLGSTPGFIIVKKVSSGAIRDWWCWHKSISTGDLSANDLLRLNELDGTGGTSPLIGTASSTMFEIAGDDNVNASGNTYIAYVFADNPSNQIKCGTFSNNTGSWGPPASEDATVDLGFQPQFVLAKCYSASGGWYMQDVERGWSTSGDHQVAYRNASVQAQFINAEVADGNFNFNATSTGFEVTYCKPGDHIYLAIGSPKTTTSATQLTLTDTTVSRASDESLVEGVSIDQAITVGESIKVFGIESYWITTFSHPSGAKAEPRGMAVDNSGNVYFAGEENSVDNAAYVAKLNGGGNISWQKSLNHAGSNEAANDVAVDSLNNVYYCGYSQASSIGNMGGIVAKYDSSGTLQWQQLLSNTFGWNPIGLMAIETDSSDNVIVAGNANIDISGSQNRGVLIVKYNSSGAVQWKRTLNQEGSSKNEYGYGVAVDSSDNIYVCGSAKNDSGYNYNDCLIVKYDSYGNIQWQKLLGDQYSSTEDQFKAITVDSSDNIYVIGHSLKPTNNNDTIIAKYDTSGNLVWQKYIPNDSKGWAIDTDSSGNVYILTQNIRVVGAGSNDFYIAKLDSSGDFVWQRTFGGTSHEDTYNLFVDSSDNLYIGGITRSLSSNWQTVVAKLPTDGSLVGTYGGLTYQSVSLNIGTSTLQDRVSNFRDSAADSSGGGDNSQVNHSAATLPDQFDPGYTANVTAITGASATVSAYSGNTITLSDVSGTWSTGMKIEGATIDTKDNPDAVNPYTVSLTSSEPTASAGVIVSWANAEWEVAEDSGFTSNVQSAVSSLTSSGTQVGPTGFAFDGSKNYYVRTKYNSSNPPSVQSEWSPTNMFITGVKATVSLPSIFSPVDGEGVGLPRTYTPKSSAITSIDFDSNWTPSAFESLTGISEKSYHYYTFSNTNAYDGNTQLAQSLAEAFPTGTQVDVPGGGYVSGYTSNSQNSYIMQIRKDEKAINSSTYIDDPNIRDTFPQYFDNLYHMPGYNGPHGRYIMTHSNFDTFYSDDGGATIRPLGEIPNEAGAMSADCFAYNPLTQVLIVTKASTHTGGRLIWYSNNGGASWTKATNTSVGGQSWRHPYFVAFSYDSNGNPTSGELRVNTSSDNYITSNHARSTDGVNWYPLQGISTGWPGVGHYYHVAADKCVVLEQKRNGMHIKYGPGTGVNITSGEQYSNMSSFPRESIDGDLEQIDKVVYDPYLGKMFMFGGWEPRVWYSDNATHWTRKEMSPAGGSPNVINTGSSYLYVFQKYRDFYYTTDPSQNSSTWTHVQNALPYMSNPKDMVNKMIVGGHNNAGVGYYSELGIAGYNAGYSMGDTISALTSTTIPGLPANAVSPTSSAPTASAGTISSWDYAEWQLATDAAFTQNVQTSTASLSSSGTQSGPSFSYNNGTVYYIRTRYVAADPVGPVSDWSSPIHFQTAP